jgi:F-type H+-transporting ATPase subunit a
MEVHASFTAEKIFDLFGIAVNNSVLTAFIAVGLITLLIVVLKNSLNATNPTNFELLVETIYNFLYDLVADILGRARSEKFFGFLLTFFVLILVSNWFGLMPFVPAIGIVKPAAEHGKEAIVEKENVTSFALADNPLCLITGKCILSTEGLVTNTHFTPLFRAPTADLSMALALALISLIVTNVAGIVVGGGKYLKKFFDFSNPIGFFVGFLELVSEFGKIISFAFRLFGNVFAGEILLSVITAISFGIVTLPFLGLEIFVGLIQAFVFFLLTAVFIGLAVDTHH